MWFMPFCLETAHIAVNSAVGCFEVTLCENINSKTLNVVFGVISVIRALNGDLEYAYTIINHK